ncbi:MAG: hypothetical protein ACK5P7_06220 [Bdellovibrio sp.]|jgi:stalled ribosome rescue protein Dom34
MKTYVVWLNSKNAQIFRLDPAGVDKLTVTKKVKESRHPQYVEDKDLGSSEFYRDVTTNLKEADQILLIGPGLAKNHFQTYLTTHQTHTLAKKVVGLEKFESDKHKSDKQLLARAHKFFRAYDLFHNPI